METTSRPLLWSVILSVESHKNTWPKLEYWGKEKCDTQAEFDLLLADSERQGEQDWEVGVVGLRGWVPDVLWVSYDACLVPFPAELDTDERREGYDFGDWPEIVGEIEARYGARGGSRTSEYADLVDFRVLKAFLDHARWPPRAKPGFG